jgi:hypothetical protein
VKRSGEEGRGKREGGSETTGEVIQEKREILEGRREGGRERGS